MHRIWSIIINGKLSFFPVFSCEKHDIECQKLAKIVSYLQSLERKIYLAINDWIKGNGIRRRLSIGRESVANSNDAKVTSISRFKRRSIRKSRAWNFFFPPDDRNWIFRVFESAAIRFVPRCQRPAKLCQLLTIWTRSILALEGKKKKIEKNEGLIECYYRCVILKGELEAWKN